MDRRKFISSAGLVLPVAGILPIGPWGRWDANADAIEPAIVDFVAHNPGLTLFHCHMQLHMDFGFMGLFDYV
jgi:FtsP/CotA-like multicopper oxidase with cupredoxin domain